jgi:uncharacterized coiled-coil protein SlyX
MFRNTYSFSSQTTQDEENKRIRDAIMNNNLQEVRRFVSSSNINNIITQNGYTPLTVALSFENNNDIVNYLLELLPTLTNVDKDIIEKSRKEYLPLLVQHFTRSQQKKIDSLCDKNDDLKKRNETLESNIKYMNNSISGFNEKLSENKRIIEKLTSDNKTLTAELKTKNREIEIYQEETNKIKRKYQDLEAVNEVLLKKTKK